MGKPKESRRVRNRKLPGQGRSRPRGTRGTELIDCYAHQGTRCGLCGGTGKVEVAK